MIDPASIPNHMKCERFISKNGRQKLRCRVIKSDGRQCLGKMRSFSCGFAMCAVHGRKLLEELEPLSFVEV